jgi:uncharacterized protein YeaO (DUF488 family)
MIRIKRVYEKPSAEDGARVLVDRLWPRRLGKERAKIDLWLKEVAPSEELRKWFSHDPHKGVEFMRRYFQELENKKILITQILDRAHEGSVTLLYGAKDKEINNAVVLAEYIKSKMRR